MLLHLGRETIDKFDFLVDSENRKDNQGPVYELNLTSDCQNPGLAKICHVFVHGQHKTCKND